MNAKQLVLLLFVGLLGGVLGSAITIALRPVPGSPTATDQQQLGARPTSADPRVGDSPPIGHGNAGGLGGGTGAGGGGSTSGGGGGGGAAGAGRAPAGGQAHPVDQAFALLLDGRPAECLVVLTDALAAAEPKIDRADEALFWKARSLRELGRPDEAVEVLGTLVERFPESRLADDAVFQQADVLERDLQKYDAALATYKDLGDRYPQSDLNAWSNFRQGEIYYGPYNDLGNAQKKFIEADQLAQANRGLAQDQLELPGQILDGAQVDNYEGRRARERLRFLHMNGMNVEVDQADEALALFAAADHTLRMGETLKGIGLLKKLLARFPEHAIADDAQFLVAETFRAAGLFEEAIRENRRLVDAHPESPHRADAVKNLESLASLKHTQQRALELQVDQAEAGR